MCVNVHATPITRCGLLPALGQQVKRAPSGHERTSGAYHSGHSKIVCVTVRAFLTHGLQLHYTQAPYGLPLRSRTVNGLLLPFTGVNSVINPNNLRVSTL